MTTSTEPSSQSVVARTRLEHVYASLQAEPHRHDFYALMRLLEALNRTMPRFGKALRPRDEPVRLGQDAELDFAAMAVSSFRHRSGASPRIGQRFFGLFGPMGPLPLHLTEYARERERNHADATFARFADSFHHRAVLLFYRAWAQSQPTVHLDRRDDDRYTRWIDSVCGMGINELARFSRVADDAKRHRAALLSRGARNAEGLVKLLQGYFGMPFRLESHVGHWLVAQQEDRTRLTPPDQPQPRNVLGHTAVAGARVWDRQYRFRLHLGPLTFAQYQRFLPGESAMAALCDWVRHYVGLSLSFDVVAWLRGQDVPRLQLGRTGAGGGQLGWTTWLGARSQHADRGNLHLRPGHAKWNRTPRRNAG